MIDERIAGVDEAGRGPLAGPVVAAAVILDPLRYPPGLADSKTLSAARRETLATAIRQCAPGVGIGVVGREDIDTLNILEATMLAMQKAVASLPIRPDRVLVDGNRAPKVHHTGKPCPAEWIVRGDATDPAIGAASIIAKVYRDELMVAIDRSFPEYGFARHKGYGTREHCAKLAEIGPCSEHRRSFAPVRRSAVRS